MTKPTLLVTTDERMLAHEPGHETRGQHPERPARLSSIHARISAVTSPTWVTEHDAPALDRSVLEWVHVPEHVDRVLAARGRSVQLDPDTGTSPGSVDAALDAAAHAVHGVSRIFDDSSIRRAFALVRPPGHHAEPTRAMGFCLFNNLAIAIEAARRGHGVRRVLVVDWDVHHGNGTQAAFWTRDDVLVFDVHQSPHYPGTGALTEIGGGAGRGYTINVPASPGLGDEDYGALFEHVLLPVADAFAPELVVLAAGFDAHEADPLGDMRLSTAGFGRLAGVVASVADRHAGGRMLATLEGGYALDALADSVVSCARVFGESPRTDGSTPDPAPPAPPRPSARARELMHAVAGVHGGRWPLSVDALGGSSGISADPGDA
jgi:acetoin utilization deacetylase AcuC-like enzyme